MRQNIVIGGAVALFFFLANGVMTAVAVKYGTPSLLWDAILWGSVTGMVMTAVTLFIFILSETTERSFGVPALFANSGICIVASALFFYYLPISIDEKLPGITVSAVIQINDVTALRRKYFFWFATPENSHATFYLNADDIFILTVIDVRNESYSLEVKLGDKGIPLEKFISLLCEEGSGSNYSFLRVLVNGTEVARRDIPSRIDLGSRQWRAGSIASDEDGRNNAALMLVEIVAWPITPNKKETSDVVKNVRDFYGF